MMQTAQVTRTAQCAGLPRWYDLAAEVQHEAFVCTTQIEQEHRIYEGLSNEWWPTRCHACDTTMEQRGVQRTAYYGESRKRLRLRERLASANLRPEMRAGSVTLENLPDLYASSRTSGGVTPERYREVATAVKDFVSLPPLLRTSGVASIVYIYGPKGVGKSWLAEAAVAHAVLELGLSGEFTSHEAICAAVLRSFASDGVTKEESQAAVIGGLQGVGLLAIDDVGRKTTATEWELNTLLRVVDERYRLSRPTIISSNYAVKELYELWSDAEDPRKTKLAELLCDRLADAKHAISLPMLGRSLRRER